MISITSNAEETMKQRNTEAKYWLLQFPTTYGASLETAPAFELEGGIAV